MNGKTLKSRLVDIDTQMVRLLYQNSPTGVVVNISVAMLLASVLWQRVPQQALLIWVAAVFLVNGLRFYNFWRFRVCNPEDSAISAWRMYFMLGTMLSAVVWGIAPWWLGPFENIITPLIMAFAQGGMMAGAAAILGGVLKIYISYSLVIMTPIILWFLQRDDPAEASLGIMLMIAVFALISNGLIYRRVLRDSIQLSNACYHAKEEAEEANRAKAHFLSRMSLELRTPLSAILGYAQLLQEQQVRGTQGRVYADQIVDASDHLLALINDLLDLSRIESHSVELEIKQLSAYQLLTQCVQTLQPVAHENKVHISAPTSTAHDLIVDVDEQRIRQILLNLLTNACGYNSPGGRVGVGFELLNDQMVRLHVDDQSLSIPESLYDQMFLSYHRLGRDESAVEGTGLGLMISQQLIELMHGRLGVEAEVGQPARFYIDLPRAVKPSVSPPTTLGNIIQQQPFAGV